MHVNPLYSGVVRAMKESKLSKPSKQGVPVLSSDSEDSGSESSSGSDTE